MAKKLLFASTLHVIWGDGYEGIRCQAGILEKDFSFGNISKDYREAYDWARTLSTTVENGSSVQDLLTTGKYTFVDGTIKELENEPRGR